MDYLNSPDYLRAADLHNVGSGTKSFFSDPVGSIGDGIAAAVDFSVKTPVFALTAVASGVNSIYNTAVVAGNWLGITDAKENDLQSTLSSYDSDLGSYYEAHKGAVDLGGFVAGAFVPGTVGVKLVNTGQRLLSGAMKSGGVASGLAEATGLIATVGKDGKTLATVAGEALAQGQQVFSWTNANVIKAIGQGVGQAAIDAAAFEAMVQATMFRSPILEGQDIKDIGSNILTGALFGGVVGGAFNAAGVRGTIKRVMDAADAESAPFRQLGSTASFGESDKIVIRAADIDMIPATTDPKLLALAAKKVENARLDIRTSVMRLGGDDKEVSSMVADIFDGLSGDQIANTIGGATRLMRVGSKAKVTPESEVGFVKLHGTNGVGDITFDTLPVSALNLTTRVGASGIKAGQDLKGAMDDFVSKQGFKEGTSWSPQGAPSLDNIEARYIWAEKNAQYKSGMKINEDDIPLLEGAIRNNLAEVTIMQQGGGSYLTTGADIAKTIGAEKQRIAQELMLTHPTGWSKGLAATSQKPGAVMTSEEIARAVNVDVRFLESEETASYLARQDAQALSDAQRAASGKAPIDLDYHPQHIGVVYDASRAAQTNTDLVNAMVNVKQQEVILREKFDKGFAQVAGDLNGLFPDSKFVASQIAGANRSGAGAGLITSANGDYNTLASTVEQIGKSTSALSERLKLGTEEIIGAPMLKLLGDQKSAIEFAEINRVVNMTTEKYVLNESETGLIARSVKQMRDAQAAGKDVSKFPELQGGAPAEIMFQNPNARDAVIAHMKANGARVTNSNTLRNAEGSESTIDPSTFYGIKPDPKEMKFFAFVKDERITGQAAGHTSMIHANTAKQLEDMITKINNKGLGYKVYTKGDAEKFYKARQDYEFDRTLHENYIDSSLKSNGINSQFNSQTDPEAIVNAVRAQHSRRDLSLARDAVAVKYSHEFDQLRSLGAQHKGVAGSQYQMSERAVEKTSQNPYNDYIKTALNISKMSEQPILNSVNQGLENAVNGTIQKLVDAYKEVKLVSDLPRINQLLEEAGIKHAYADAAELVLANHTAPKPYLSNFVRGANAILANTFLRLDFLNPIANAVGSQVLLGHETNSQVKALMRDVAKGGVKVPGVEDTVLSPLKMIAKANADFLSKDTPELDALFRYHGLDVTFREQMHAMLDDLSLKGTENVAQLNTRLASALDKSKKLVDLGGKVTGNDLAEKYNRWVSAHVAHQIGGARIEAGLMQADAMPSFLNTFVNRTQTNSMASQRPLLFQGPIGQAVGLFQSFQFNTMQQLFKGVAEGGAKDAAMMMGLQGTIFGLNGLPGFQFINQHIVGTASGNKEHTDAYSLLYGAAGKEAGDWLMYGIPSNMLQTNLYSRGDINPRTLTVIPVNPADIVAVSAFGKFAANMKETLGKMASGGDVWQSFLQGVEHNGLSRPLAGLAQTLQATGPSGKVFSTTNAGNINFTNDFMSLATLSRLAGGKPLDEALANDEVARGMVYKAADRAKMKAATETFKTHVTGDMTGNVTPLAVNHYLNQYVAYGGRADDFNKNMLKVLTEVNTPRANAITNSLKGPYAERMKELMGGQIADLDSQ